MDTPAFHAAVSSPVSIGKATVGNLGTDVGWP